ncbi:MAG: hypothetical protein C0483_18820 [Pirellula sp.]|nr:hypothetical protein [Pirellula sp.]
MRKFLIVICVLGGGVAAAAYAGWLPGRKDAKPATAEQAAASAAAKKPEAVAVTVALATARPIERRVRTVGTLHGYEEIEISPLVDGHVRRVLHDVGDVVAPGEPLLEIDDADFRLAVQEMGRALELELAKLGLVAVPDKSFDVGGLPGVLRARLVEENAAETYERYKGLVDRNAITKDDFQKAELNLDVARLDTKQRVIEAEQSLAAVRHRQAILETAEKRLRDARIVTPPLTTVATVPSQISLVSTASAGAIASPSYTVCERLVSEGEIVKASPPTKLFRLVVENPLKFQAAIPERHSAQVRVGQTVDLAVESLPGQTVVGRVVRVNPTVDTANRTFQVEIAVPNSERRLKPGSFATASILIGSDAQAVTVPEEAIIRFAGVTKLFALSGDKVVAVPVETGTRMEVRDAAGAAHRWVEVIGGLRPGAAIVTTGHSQLAEGSQVRVRETATPAVAAPLPHDADVRQAGALEAAAPRKEAR